MSKYKLMCGFRHNDKKTMYYVLWLCGIIIDHEAREIMYLVASVRPSVRLSVRYHSHA